MSLRTRMGIASGIAVALAVIAVAVFAYAGMRSELLGQIDDNLHSLSAQVLPGPGGPGAPSPGGGEGSGGPQGPGFGFGTRGAEPPGVGDEGLGIDRRARPAFGGAPGIITLIYRNGNSYVPRGQQYRIPVNAQMKAIAASGRGQYMTDIHVGGSHLRVLVTGIGADGALAVALPLTNVDHTLASQLLLLVMIAAGGIALAAVLGILVAQTALAPIERFTRQTELIASEPERLGSERLDERGGDELARLARTFNATLAALEQSVQAQRNLVADASHELRTPIASIRANLQLMRDEALLSQEDREALRSDIIEELDELTALVADVVELARGSKQIGKPEDLRLDQVLEGIIERYRRRSPEINFTARLEPTLIQGDGDRVARALSNLVDNAVKYGPDGPGIEVDLQDGTVTVRDHGPGFDERELTLVFDRFHRAKDARSKPGSGLGLAIVRQAAEAHGGFVEATNATDGGAILRINFGPTQRLDDAAPVGALSARPIS